MGSVFKLWKAKKWSLKPVENFVENVEKCEKSCEKDAKIDKLVFHRVFPVENYFYGMLKISDP